jgi:alpha-methylacyl-CoA racemase
MNVLDSGAPFYDVYECSDGHYVSVAPIETKFLEQLIEILELPPACAELARDREKWPALRKTLADEFKKEPRTYWCSLLRGSDACFAPVLSMDEAPHDEHLRARGTFVTVDGIVQPAPAPQFSRSRPANPTPPQPSQSITDCDLVSTWLSSE